MINMSVLTKLLVSYHQINDDHSYIISPILRYTKWGISH